MEIRHVEPIADLIEYEDSDECICGPTTEFLEGGLQLVIHNSLDGRELTEEQE